MNEELIADLRAAKNSLLLAGEVLSIKDFTTQAVAIKEAIARAIEVLQNGNK